ncbi:hypothetical protein ACJX0J_009347 [Zea mays]
MDIYMVVYIDWSALVALEMGVGVILEKGTLKIFEPPIGKKDKYRKYLIRLEDGIMNQANKKETHVKIYIDSLIGLDATHIFSKRLKPIQIFITPVHLPLTLVVLRILVAGNWGSLELYNNKDFQLDLRKNSL